MKQCLVILAILLLGQSVWSQSQEIINIRKYRTENTGRLINEFSQFLSIPNVAADPAGQQKNAAFIMDMMKKRGIQNVQLLHGITPGVTPSVYGDITIPGAKQTIIFYAHYDGQPVNPAQWAKGLEPFSPKLFSAALDKGGASIPFPANG